MEKNKIKIAAAGDILITRNNSFSDKGTNEIADFLKQADVRIANLETTITDGSCYASAYSGGTWLTASPKCLDDIKKYGFQILGLANNHIMDYSYEGLAMTVQNLQSKGLLYAGCGENLYEASKPVYMETPSGRIAVIDLCSTFDPAARAGNQTKRMKGRPGLNPLRAQTIYRVTREHAEALKQIAAQTEINALRELHREQGFIDVLPKDSMEFGEARFEIVDDSRKEGRFSKPDERDVLRTVETIKEARYSCSTVIVMIHSHEIKGKNESEPDYFMEEFAHTCIDAGADIIIGSGTHRMKGIELYKQKPIFYCLGNFMFQNEFVDVLPAEFMEKYGIPDDSSAPMAIEERTKKSSHSLYEQEEIYWSVLPLIELEEGICSHIELMPIELGFGREKFERYIARPAAKEDALKILKYLNLACEKYHTAWRYENGRFV